MAESAAPQRANPPDETNGDLSCTSAMDRLQAVSRYVATAAPGDRVSVFLSAARELQPLVLNGALPFEIAKSHFRDIAITHRLFEEVAEPTLARAISSALVPGSDLHLETLSAEALNAPGYRETHYEENDIGAGEINIELDLQIDSTDKIVALAQLPPTDYERVRKAAAKEMGFRSSLLDKLVLEQKQRVAGESGGIASQGHDIELFEAEPWDRPVDGPELLNGLSTAIREYVVLSADQANAIALWVVHTYMLDAFEMSPRLAIKSPEPGCGKTTLIDVLSKVIWRPLAAVNISVAAVFRTVEAFAPTLLIDEGDSFLPDNEPLRGVLNGGHRRGAHVIRLVGEDIAPKKFRTFCATAIALLGELPATLDSRSIPIELKRKLRSDPARRFFSKSTPELDILARKTRRWSEDNLSAVSDTDPPIGNLFNRAADNWLPLLAIAHVAGGQWPALAVAAANSRLSVSDTKTESTLLLGHIKSIFDRHDTNDYHSSQNLICDLAGIESSPWKDYRNGNPITPKALAKLLKPFGIVPSSDGRNRGYRPSDFRDAYRYLDPDCLSNEPQPVNVSVVPVNTGFPVVLNVSEHSVSDASKHLKEPEQIDTSDALTDETDLETFE